MEVKEELIKKCLKEEARAQHELYKLCYPFMMSIGMRYHKNTDDAASSLNQAFLKILKNLKKYDRKQPFKNWIARIMLNTVVDEYRKNKNNLQVMDYVDFSEADVQEGITLNEAETAVEQEVIVHLVQQLPETTRQVFNLYTIDGYSHKEISDLVGVSEGASRWHVSTARKLLKEKLERISASSHLRIVYNGREAV